MHTAALVGLDGSIDWYCAPRFDSPSVFAALLDSQKGGRFQLSPTGKFTTKQSYGGDTNVLATTFDSQEGRIRLTDFMPCFMEKGELKVFQELHRIVDCLEGDPELRSRKYDHTRNTRRMSGEESKTPHQSSLVLEAPCLRQGPTGQRFPAVPRSENHTRPQVGKQLANTCREI